MRLNKKLRAATTEAFFSVCREPQIEVRQSPLLLEKWNEMMVGPIQVVLGLVVDTTKLMIGITQEYCNKLKSMQNDN
jgi:hypothetical protein